MMERVHLDRAKTKRALLCEQAYHFQRLSEKYHGHIEPARADCQYQADPELLDQVYSKKEDETVGIVA